MSSAELNSRVLSCDCVKPGFCDLKSAMIAAAFGAAADVPKNVVGKPPAPDTATPSAAVRSGLKSVSAPDSRKLPGVSGVPSPE